VGIREAVSLLRLYDEGRHGDWNNYSNLKGTNNKGEVGGMKITHDRYFIVYNYLKLAKINIYFY